MPHLDVYDNSCISQASVPLVLGGLECSLTIFLPQKKPAIRYAPCKYLRVMSNESILTQLLKTICFLT